MNQSPKSGKVPFAVIPDGRTIIAYWRETDDGLTNWSFELDGKKFKEFDSRNLLSDLFKSGREPAYPVKPMSDGRFRVKFSRYVPHHLGSVSADVELFFDVKKFEVECRMKSQVDLDPEIG